MIQAARWWSPNLTCNPEPLSTLLSNNAKEESGWLRNLLFPATTIDANSQYQQDLTLSYLLSFAENKGLAGEVATAWGTTLESAIKTRKVTVFAAGMYYPVNKVILEISSKREAMLDLLNEYPHGCLRPTWKYTSVDQIQVSCAACCTYTNSHKSLYSKSCVFFSNLLRLFIVDVYARRRSPFRGMLPSFKTHSEPIQVRCFIRQVQHESSSEESLRWAYSRAQASSQCPPARR